MHSTIFYKYKIVLWELFFAASKIRAMQIRAMKNRASRGMTVISLFFLRPDYSSRSPSCLRLWRRQNSWRTLKLMNPLIFLVKTITPTLNMSPHTPFKNVYDDWRHTVLKKGSAFLVQQNAKAQTNFRGWESIFIIYKVVYMYAIVHCTKHHGKDNQITLSAI